MITTSLDEDGRLTVPPEVARALGIAPGGRVSFHILASGVVLTGEGEKRQIITSPFGAFTEWADEADRAFDGL